MNLFRLVTRTHALLIIFSTGILSTYAFAEENNAKYQIYVTVTNLLTPDRFSQNWPVHIYLAAPGSKIPLSSITTLLDELPFSSTLTEHNKVLPMFTLEGHKELVLVVKVSSSGDPHKQGPEDFRQVSQVIQLNSDNKASVNLNLIAE